MKAEETELLKSSPRNRSPNWTASSKNTRANRGTDPRSGRSTGLSRVSAYARQKRIAAGLNLPLSRVYGVVTFYSFFTMTPRGKYTVRVCLGTACYVRGGKALAETLEKQFGIKEGETTADRLFTLESVRCLGACGLGPVIVVGEDVHGRVKPGKVKEILSQYN